MRSYPGRDIVLFDAGGTLIRLDFDRVRSAFAETGVSPPDDVMDEAEARARLWADAELRRCESVREIWNGYFHRMLAASGVPAKALPDAIDRLWSMNDELGLWRRPVEGAAEILVRLKRCGLRLAVVSNAEGQVERDLDEVGLLAHLEFVIDSHLVGVAKPDPRIFEIALDRLGATPDRAVYVGDVPAFDVEGARAAGIPPILIDPHGVHSAVDVPRIESLRQLPAHLGYL